MTSSEGSGYSYSGKKIVGELIILPPVPKDDRKYTIAVETLAEKFAPKKKAATVFKADAYYKHVAVVLPKASSTPGAKSTRKPSNLFIFIAPIVILAAILFLSRDKLPLLVTYINEKISKSPISSQGTSNVRDSADSADEASTFDSFSLRKRKKRLA